MLKNLELQNTNNTDNNSLKSGVGLKEYLYSTLLRNLVHTFGKLFTLHGVNLLNHGEMLGSKGGNTFKFDLFSLFANGISN